MLEKSAGAIIFHKSDRKIEYLLLQHELGHWDFPKGHIEKGETVVTAARREIEEETGLSHVIFLPDFREHIKYFYKVYPSEALREGGWEGENRFKVVTFFLGESKTKKVKISHEHLGYRWVLHGEALKLCQFKNQKDLLKKAKEFLMK